MGKRFNIAQTLVYGVLCTWCTIVILPILWMVLGAFKTKREFFLEPLALPNSFSFAAFERAIDAGLLTFLLNSAMVTTVSVVVIVTFSGMAAYVLARSDSLLMKTIYLLIVVGFAVPGQAVLIPMYQMMSNLGLLNQLFGIVLPYAAFGIPFTVILFYAFFLDFPRELEEAARLDGCNQIQTFFQVVLPLTGPAVASAAIFQAVFVWNEFVIALLMLTKQSVKTLPVGILHLSGRYSSDWSAIMAGLTMAVIPILIVFILAQKSFVRSMAGLGK